MRKGKIDYCPYCWRDILPPERPFDLEYDNHIARCHFPGGSTSFHDRPLLEILAEKKK